MLLLHSSEPATVLDAAQLAGYGLMMIALMLLDVIVSPLVTNVICRIALTHSRFSIVVAVLEAGWRLARNFWYSPWQIKALGSVALRRLLPALLDHSYNVRDGFLWYLFGSSGTLGFCIFTLASLYGNRKITIWFQCIVRRLRSLKLAQLYPHAWEPTQGALCKIGLRLSDRLRRFRPLLARPEMWVVRAWLFSLVWTSHILTPEATLEASRIRPASSFVDDTDAMRCFSFTGFPIDCRELQRVRSFNRDVMPRYKAKGVASVRKAMNAHGLYGHIWHVGHACPDPSKSSAKNDEDYGWNLFAQHAVDNSNLGHCLVSCAEAEHLEARHVQCTGATAWECIRSCDSTAADLMLKARLAYESRQPRSSGS